MSFQIEEATIASIHTAMMNKELTCRELVEMYVQRIHDYDQNGPEINAIVDVNMKVMEEADELDTYLAAAGKLKGPLHGIPILVKDQVDTKGIRTTYGSEVFDEHIPDEDAEIIKKLKQDGAIVLAKTLLPDFAASFFACSSSGGETKNPYALDRDAGGSSSGSAAGVAANFGAVAIGEDTAGSIRLPASFNNIFGVRVTTGLISRHGLSSLVHFQDTPGPMTRTVKDAAILLDTMVGYDPKDPYTTAVLQAKDAGTYTEQLSAEGLNGARIGILREAFGPEGNPDCAAVNEVAVAAIAAMEENGAEVIDSVSIPDLEKYTMETALYHIQSKYDINQFLETKGEVTLEEIYEKGQYHRLLDLFHAVMTGPDRPEENPLYYKQRHLQEVFRREIENVLALHDLDALAFPDVQVLPPTRDELYSGKWMKEIFPTNTLISSQTGLPSLSMPAGFTQDGIPVGIQLLGRSYDEATLLTLAYGYEQKVRPRKSPALDLVSMDEKQV
ncbi:amidase [Bacillus sp. SB49]|uniref:amidase n=1 Tax=Bacillus sp. SB49 TaxID=1071080 RepID=UPI00041416D9|nr:amidase [Bacillus sp. SB49]QHT46402.1 amidase [Bacillus sp. SB49]